MRSLTKYFAFVATLFIIFSINLSYADPTPIKTRVIFANNNISGIKDIVVKEIPPFRFNDLKSGLIEIYVEKNRAAGFLTYVPIIPQCNDTTVTIRLTADKWVVTLPTGTDKFVVTCKTKKGTIDRALEVKVNKGFGEHDYLIEHVLPPLARE